MVRSKDFARNYRAYEEDQIREAVRQHEARRAARIKQEVLPSIRITGMLAGWMLIDALTNFLRNKR